MLSYYDNREFFDPKHPSGIDWTVNAQSMSKLLVNIGLIRNNKYQEIMDFAVYPSIYFCTDGESENKYATHHFAATWLPKKIQNKNKNKRHRRIGKLKKLARKILGDRLYEKLKKLRVFS